MTLTDAIAILCDHSELILVAKNPNLRAAMHLAIAALVRINNYRTNYPLPGDPLLPGEAPKRKVVATARS